MYFPYLRGKQYELLALKELADLLGPAGKVTPIIEPVREPDGSGLDRCITTLSDNAMDFTLIANPTVGDLKQNSSISDRIRTFVANDSERSANWNVGLIIEEHTDTELLLEDFRNSFARTNRLTLIHKGKSQNLGGLKESSQHLNRQIDVIDSRLRMRHFREFLTSSDGVTLSDPFPAQGRNSDYPDSQESMFSEEHLYYSGEGWYGFSDYLTIGEAFTDGGFTPRAVVIHWTYQNDETGPIMIRHFASDNNLDTSNVAGKFLEALNKLVEFLDENHIHTRAAEAFRLNHERQNYPGLGILKKLSVQNHLELVSKILSR